MTMYLFAITHNNTAPASVKGFLCYHQVVGLLPISSSQWILMYGLQP